MILNVAIVEDDALIANLLKDYVHNIGHHVIFKSDEYQDFFTKLAAEKPDVALLDINLENNLTAGIEIGTELSKLGIPFVYITAYSDTDTLEKAVKSRPLGYLVKPFMEAQLRALLEMAKEEIKKNRTRITIQTGTGPREISLKEVRYIESVEKGMIFHLNDSSDVTSTETFHDVMEALPHVFIIIHDSYVLNMQYLIGLNEGSCLLKGQVTLPVGDEYRQALVHQIEAYPR